MAVLAASTNVKGFVTESTTRVAHKNTEIHAMPPMIIGPMIRKMREEKQKQKMPMATENEMKGQAPGLRVGGAAWKWPPVWPYDQTFFTPPEDLKKPDPTSQLNGMAGMLSGIAQLPTPDAGDVQEEDMLDTVKYWKEDKADIRTELDEEAAQKLKRCVFLLYQTFYSNHRLNLLLSMLVIIPIT